MFPANRRHVNPPSMRSLTGWGRVTASRSRTWSIGSRADALMALSQAGDRGVIARGLGRSYGDPSLNDGGDVLDLTGFSSIHHFDPETGVICCDAGVTFNDLLSRFLPLGWLPPVCPGTSWVTIGGAVANDVHGKNHHLVGSFGDHVDWIDLLLPHGEIRRVSRHSDPELFSATVGGIGLTGIVLTVQFRMVQAPTNAVELREVRIPNLETFLDLLQEHEQAYPYAVGWIDALSAGRHMGRGILELARTAERPVPEPLDLSVRIPFNFPNWALNRATVGAFNATYIRRVARDRTRCVHVRPFLFPLDALRDWNRMYGRRGVYQFQCVVPFADGRAAIRRIMERMTQSGGASFLCVLKTMSRAGLGHLSFGMAGFTLALDIPRRADTPDLISRLEDIAVAHGGRVYLAKDACLSAQKFRRMYPAAEKMLQFLEQIDPRRVMRSDMSRRLGLLGT